MKKLVAVLVMHLCVATSAFAQFDFPNTPTANQIVSGPAGQALKWDGTKWVAQFGPAGGPFAPEAPLDGKSYLRTNGAWTSGGTLADDLTGSALHLTNLSGWAPLNFGQPSLAAGTSGAVTASLFAYNGGVGGNNNLNITAGAYMWNGNWNAATPTAEAIVMNPTSISLQYSTGNTVGATLGTWNNIAVFNTNGLVLPNTSSSSLFFGPASQPVGSMLGYGGGGSALQITSGGYYNGSNWIASNTNAENIQIGAGNFYFQVNTGLTVGGTFSPIQVANINSSGMGLAAGELYYINGIAQPNWGVSPYGTGAGGIAPAYCSSRFTLGPNAAKTIFSTGLWGAGSTGFLTTYTTYPGYAHQNLYAVSSFGSSAGNNLNLLLNTPYGGGDAPHAVTYAEAADGSGNHYNYFVLTNDTAQTVDAWYWFSPVGGPNGLSCY